MKNVTYVGGSKGGTGKSLTSMALVDYLRKTFPDDKVMLIDTDSSNPDVGRLYRGRYGMTVEGVLLDDAEKGWISMVEMIGDTDAKHIVINSMAASNIGIQTQGKLFEESIQSLDVDFKILWIMNRHKDSTTLLRDFLKYIKSPSVYPVLNLYFGEQDEFLFYRSSLDIQQIIGERGGRELFFPNLNELIADKLYTDEINFEELPALLKVGMRTSLKRWLESVKEVFDTIYLPPPRFTEETI